MLCSDLSRWWKISFGKGEGVLPEVQVAVETILAWKDEFSRDGQL